MMYAKGHSTFIYIIELGIFVYYINCYLNIIAYSLITFILHIQPFFFNPYPLYPL